MKKRLNTEFLKNIILTLDMVVRERGFDGSLQYELPSGLIISLYHQYPHYWRIDIKDRFKRDLTDVILLEVGDDGEAEQDS